MTRSRTITTTVTLTLLAFALSAPAFAGANPLLSGYGGPGEGSQAILGSALLNGPSGGGGGSAGSVAAAAGGGLASAGAGGGLAAVSREAASAAGQGRGIADAARPASDTGSKTYVAASSSPASQAAVAGAPALGLSREDLLYILMALGALVVTGELTRRLARRPG
jgi:hypothetical protein